MYARFPSYYTDAGPLSLASSGPSPLRSLHLVSGSKEYRSRIRHICICRTDVGAQDAAARLSRSLIPFRSLTSDPGYTGMSSYRTFYFKHNHPRFTGQVPGPYPFTEISSRAQRSAMVHWHMVLHFADASTIITARLSRFLFPVRSLKSGPGSKGAPWSTDTWSCTSLMRSRSSPLVWAGFCSLSVHWSQVPGPKECHGCKTRGLVVRMCMRKRVSVCLSP